MANDLMLIDPRKTPELNAIRGKVTGDVEPPTGCQGASDPKDCLREAGKLVKANGAKVHNLDIVGHGASGALTFGDLLLTPERAASHEVLAIFRALMKDNGGQLRLLGCTVALTGPLDESWSGPALQLALAHFLGVRVVAPRCSLFATDFGEHGLMEGNFEPEVWVVVDPQLGACSTKPKFYERYKGEGDLDTESKAVFDDFLAATWPTISPGFERQMTLWNGPSAPPVRQFDADLLAIPDSVARSGPPNSMTLEVVLGGRALVIKPAFGRKIAVRTTITVF